MSAVGGIAVVTPPPPPPRRIVFGRCATAAEERARFPLLYFFPCFYPRPILFARDARPVHVRRPSGLVRRSCHRPSSSSSSSPCLPVAYAKSFRVSRSGVVVLFFYNIIFTDFFVDF